MQFWNWGLTVWHNIEYVAFYLSKSLHPTVQVSTSTAVPAIIPSCNADASSSSGAVTQDIDAMPSSALSTL